MQLQFSTIGEQKTVTIPAWHCIQLIEAEMTDGTTFNNVLPINILFDRNDDLYPEPSVINIFPTQPNQNIVPVGQLFNNKKNTPNTVVLEIHSSRNTASMQLTYEIVPIDAEEIKTWIRTVWQRESIIPNDGIINAYLEFAGHGYRRAIETQPNNWNTDTGLYQVQLTNQKVIVSLSNSGSFEITYLTKQRLHFVTVINQITFENYYVRLGR